MKLLSSCIERFLAFMNLFSKDVNIMRFVLCSYYFDEAKLRFVEPAAKVWFISV